MTLDVDLVLREATGPFGERRFWHRGQHPATAKMRQQRDAIAASPPSALRDEFLAYINERLAMFEFGEQRIKEQYLDYMQRLDTDSLLV